MASVLYQNAVMATFENTIDWETDTLNAHFRKVGAWPEKQGISLPS